MTSKLNQNDIKLGSTVRYSIKKSPGFENRYLTGMIYERTKDLQKRGHSILFRWIPAHSNLIGNYKAHLAAKSRAEKRGKQPESWSSLAYIKKKVGQIRGKELTSWHKKKTQE